MHRHQRLGQILGLLLLFATLTNASAAGDQRVFIPIAQSIVPPESSTNLNVTSATYLGGSGADRINAVDIGLDGTIIVAGTLTIGFLPPGAAPVTLLGGGTGALLRLNSDGRQVLSVTRIGGVINDLEVGPLGEIAVCGDFGVAVLLPDASDLRWNQAGTVNRCAIGRDGSVATLAGNTATVYDTAGTQRGRWTIGGSERNDIAIDGLSQQVFVTGYTQDDGAPCTQYKSAFLRAYSYDGTATWRNYGWSKTQVGGLSLCADTNGRRVAMGRDGKLYFVGWTDGGNNIYTRQPNDISTALGSKLIGTDRFNQTFNMKGAKSLAWYGRFNPATGEIDRGQFVLTRLNDNTGNSIAIYGITADTQGTIYLTGEQYFAQERRDERQIAGTTVGSYEGGEAFLLVVSPDFRQRLIWTPFTAPGTSAGGSPGFGVAVRGDIRAVGISLSQNSGNTRRLITSNALQSTVGGGSDGYLAVWKQP